MSSWIDTLAAMEPDEARAFLERTPLPPGAARELQSAVLAALYADLGRAGRLAAASEQLAAIDGSPLSRALAARSQGHVNYLRGDYAAAVDAYESAAALFEREGAMVELGRTLSSGLQSLAYLGQYDRAGQWAERAEPIFLASGDVLRLARLDSNFGNLLFRRDQPKEAVSRYERALEGFREGGDAKDTAAALSNLAVCHTSLGNYTESLEYYRQAREHCDRHGLGPLAAQADYNIAYLHFQRGDYDEARRLYHLSRARCQSSGDAYHEALCDLDESELDLELNLTAEGEALALRAIAAFEKLGMKYEQAKALVNVAVGAHQRGDRLASDKALRGARKLFAAEGNSVWIALSDQMRAVLAFHGLRFAAAERLSRSAWNVLRRTMIPGRAAHSRLLLARLWLRAGYADRARAVCQEAVEHLGEEPSPAIRFHCSLVQAEIHETQGRWPEALQGYEQARALVEDLRTRVHGEDLRISVLQDKLGVYEALVSICLDSPAAAQPRGNERALLLVEQAKSRSLADSLVAGPGPDSPEAARIEGLRKDLNWLYRQIELAALLDRAVAGRDRGKELRDRARAVEMQLIAARRERGTASGPAERDQSAGRLQEVLDAKTAVLEYFEARGVLHAFLVSRSAIEVARLGPAAPSRQALKLLQFQLGKFRLGAGHAGSAEGGLVAAKYHLAELYALLIAPVESQLTRFENLVIAPHRHLHGLPFAALDAGAGPLGDRFRLSVTPSASVLAECLRRVQTFAGAPVIFAVPDPRTPEILEEGRAVADILPGSTLFAGEPATLANLRSKAPGCRILHLATHGTFRRDNPLFSSIQLADGPLSLFDLQRMQLPVGLLTLSACSTGSSVQVGGDEVLGLMRGFLAAGASSLLVSLWDIDDASTKEFMRAFYTRVVAGESLTQALQGAMRLMRELNPHPYHWAPFVLVGDARNPGT